MGKNNRQRRKAKAKTRAQRAGRRTSGTIPRQETPGGAEQRARARYAVQMQLFKGSCDCGECDLPTWESLAAELFTEAHRPGWATAIAQAFADLGDRIVQDLWELGWMPRDLECVFDKHLTKAAATIARVTVAGQCAAYPEAGLSGLWRAQRAALTAKTPATGIHALLAQTEKDTLADQWALGLEALDLLSRLPDIPIIQPLPGSDRVETVTGRTAEGARIYDKVAALLAKAESTDSDAEAEAFTAKAQQLITRYSIDEARLIAHDDRAGETTGIRIPIERPYESPKAELLTVIAHANHCHAVYGSELGFSTVIGDPIELRSVELLFNSLLIQAQAAMAREGSRRDRAGRSRTRSFRQSFLVAFAFRIGERLRESAETTVRDEGRRTGTDLVPLLERRLEDAERKAAEWFPEMRMRRPSRVGDHEGYAAGRAAADRARLQGSEEIGSH